MMTLEQIWVRKQKLWLKYLKLIKIVTSMCHFQCENDTPVMTALLFFLLNPDTDEVLNLYYDKFDKKHLSCCQIKNIPH